MKKLPLELGTLYTATIEDVSFGTLDDTILKQLYSDGRIFGRMIEPIIANIFEDFDCVVGGSKKFDLVRTSTKQKQEVKSFTKNGCKLVPSNQVGSGRTLNKKDFQKRAKSMEAYFVADCRDFPHIKIIALSSATVLKNYPSGTNICDSIFKSNNVVHLGSIRKPE